ncbi:MAG: ABC transporter ATP-binding protein [Candidatus Solibacter usitatus]|nr:ABC transporter ATP-binding protein [Candidatus Solibacter usitatus]
MEPLLSLRISAGYPGRPAVLQDVALDLEAGGTLGLVGQSGSGKSTLALAILRLLHLKGGRTEGRIQFAGRDLTECGEREMRRLRGREIGLVLQSASSSLNPALRIGTQLREAWRAHADSAWEKPFELLSSVGLPADDAFLRRLPGEISVGQAQRVLIAMSVLHRPSLLIADEPTSALDLITQAEVLRLLAALNRERNMATLFISHDLLSIASYCRRVAILHEGRIVECGETGRIFSQPAHPYTRRLVEALPRVPLDASLNLASLAARLEEDLAQRAAADVVHPQAE